MKYGNRGVTDDSADPKVQVLWRKGCLLNSLTHRHLGADHSIARSSSDSLESGIAPGIRPIVRPRYADREPISQSSFVSLRHCSNGFGVNARQLFADQLLVLNLVIDV